jgi:hypothetical protein
LTIQTSTSDEQSGQTTANSDQFSTAIKRLTAVEKEIFDMHRS